MREIILTAEIFSCVIIAIILYASIRESLTRGHKDKVFSVFVAIDLFLIVIDAISNVVDGRQDLLMVAAVTSYISVIGSYLLTVSFGEYLKLHLAENGGNVGQLQRINTIYGIIAMIIGTVACIKGALFSFDNGYYTEGSYYPIYLCSMIPMYVIQFIMLMKNIKKIPWHDAVAFLCYSLMPVFMTGVGMMAPGLSLSLPAMAISILLIYVTMQSGLHRSAAVREAALREKSYTDDLTGALNRRAYSERCDELKDTDRVRIAFCDVNGLKYINDTYGHAEGDKLLRRVSESFRNAFGDGSFYRISGDEFIVLDVNSDPGVFEDKLSRMQEMMRNMEYEPVAIGTAEGNGSELAALITTAEEQMYASKALFHRRNPQYVRSGDLFVRDILDDSNHTENAQGIVSQTADRKRRVGTPDRILLVGSSNEEMRLLEGLLSENYELVESSSAAQAMEQLKADHSNISTVLLDVRPPEISGYEFLGEIMKDTQLATIPVILTGRNMKRAVETDYLRMGAYDCIHKPYSPDMLLNRIKRAVQLKESLNVLADVEFDELTGLHNRQAMFHYMRSCLQDGGKTAYDLTIFDIPDFKEINKRFNEEKGDQVLKYIADQIREIMCDKDGRYGRYDADIFMIFTCHGEFDETQRAQLAEKRLNHKFCGI